MGINMFKSDQWIIDRFNIYYIMIIVLFTSDLLNSQNEWVQLHVDPEYTISGVAQFNNGYIVVHDNKMKDQPRVSFINKNLYINYISILILTS